MNAPAKVPYRAHLASDPSRPMLRLEGGRRRRMLVAYGLLNLVVFGGLVVSAATIPKVLLVGLVLAYVLENTMFVVAHVGLHCSFMETPEREMPTITHHSFLHHYRDIRTYSKSWLESRLGYFYCPRLGFRTITAHGTITAPLLVAGGLAWWDWRVGLCALSCTWGAHLLQTIAHEWYHNPDRGTFYWAPTRWLLGGLERVGLMSTARHNRHHGHHLRNLDAVHNWLDLYLPGGEWLGDTLFAAAKKRFVPGQRRMVRTIIAAYAVYTPIHFGVLVGGFLLAALWLS